MTIDLRHPLPGTRPLVMGAGRSGVAAARLLARHGLAVRLCDARGAQELPETTGLAALGVELRLGEQSAALLDGRDFAIWSPGIPLDHPIAAAARAAAIPILSELELGYLATQAPLLCVTGTNGKSTTTDLIGTLVRATGREVEVCGNIGRAICEVAERVGPAGLLVTEVSSFQLEAVDRLQPFIATWLNLTPDHMDRYPDFASYGAAKQRLFARQEETDYAVWNADDPALAPYRTGPATALEFSSGHPVPEGAYAEDGAIVLAWRGGRERLMNASQLQLLGRHNLMNVLAALASTLPLEIAPATLRQVLGEYRGLEHRLESVANIEDVAFVNDSKATNRDSVVVALQSFDHPVVLIAGGRDKGQDFAPLATLAQRQVRTVVLIGEGAEKIAREWPQVPSLRAATLAEAVRLAYRAARPRGTVLLSPGCASYDMFRDFEDRGRQFKAEVLKLQREEAPV